MSLEIFMSIFVVGVALGLIYAMFKRVWGREIKGKEYYLTFLVFYLLVLILAGANRMKCPDTFVFKAVGFLWSLAPSQTAPWIVISLVVLVILIILVFVAGCKLIAYFMREEKDQITRGMLLRWLVGVLLTLLMGIILLVWRKSDCPYSSRSWLFGFFFMVLVIGIRILLSRRRKWLWRWRKEKDQRRE